MYIGRVAWLVCNNAQVTSEYARRDTEMLSSTTYLKALYERKDEGKEHTYRTPFENFLQELIPNYEVRQEPKRSATGGLAPDFTISSDGVTVGYIETKDIGKALDAGSEQVEKYRAICDNIILTNYLTFIWLSGENTKTVELLPCDKFSKGEFSKIEKEKDLSILFKAFCDQQPKPISDLKELAKFLAPRTSVLKDELTSLLKEDSSSQLKALRDELIHRLYEGMSDERFVDAIAQCFTHILFMARLLSNDRLKADHVFSFIPKESFPIQNELARFFDGIKASGSNWIVEQIVRTVNRLDREKLKEVQDPFLYFYEEFLGEYDPILRKSRGVYYTPIEVVSYIVRSLDTILKDSFGKSTGLAHEGVTVLDFATGTGTFLIEAFRVAIDSRPKGLRVKVIDERLLENFHGFEIMTGPYTIAHMKLYHFLRDTYGYSLKDKKRRARIYLANTLDAPGQPELSPFLPAIQNEVNEAAETRKKDILVIMGNPPFSGDSQNKGKYITNLIQDYKKVDGVYLKGERNLKLLRNDYIKFIRFAEKKMQHVKEGLVGIITSNSFLYANTFRGMRRSLMQSFDAIYILNLHGSVNKREKTPEGGKDKGVFDIKEGTCISFLIKSPNVEKGVFSYDLYGLRKEKFDFCTANDFNNTPWEKLSPQKPSYSFVDRIDSELREKYKQFHSVKGDIFEESTTGIDSCRDSLTMHPTKERLKEVVKDFMALDIEDARAKYGLTDVRDWSIERAKKDLHLYNDEAHKTIHYAAFETRYTYYTGKTAGFHSRPRGKFMDRFLEAESFGLLVSKGTRLESFTQAFVTDDIPGGSFFKDFRAYFFPLHMLEAKKKKGQTETEESRVKENINPSFYEVLGEKYGTRFTIEEVVGYIYAILYSPAYRSKYKALLIDGCEFPRIPLAPDIQTFSALAKIGRELIDKHRLKVQPSYDKVSIGGTSNHKIERTKYDSKTQRLYINTESYFTHITEEVEAFMIDNYKVLDHLLKAYLKAYKGTDLPLLQIEYIQRVAGTLQDTVLVMRKLQSQTESWI